jgi:REP element-mobilizing transposase RayT
MFHYNPAIHHRRSIRLKGYDYSQAGLYFITICVQDKICLFGKVINGKMELNEAGKIAVSCWLDIPVHFPNVTLHEYVVMPNHIHGIIELSGTSVGAKDISPANRTGNETFGIATKNISHETGIENETFGIGAKNISPISHETGTPDNGAKNISPQPPESSKSESSKSESSKPRGTSQTIGSIVRGFKIGVTKWMRQNSNVHHVWQRDYYEHIIRDELSYIRIARYIIDNPEKWKGDKFYNR